MSKRGQLEAKARAMRAVKLKLAGLTYQQVADTPIERGAEETLYASAGAAYEAIKREVMAEQVEFGGDIEELRAIVIARYDSALQAANKVLASGGKDSLAAIDRILKIEAERRQIIKGLEVPKKVENDITVDDETAEAIRLLGLLKTESVVPSLGESINE